MGLFTTPGEPAKFCPACDEPIPSTWTCCLKHWKALPYGLRKKIKRNQHFFGQHQPHNHNLNVQMIKAHRVWRGEPLAGHQALDN